MTILDELRDATGGLTTGQQKARSLIDIASRYSNAVAFELSDLVVSGRRLKDGAEGEMERVLAFEKEENELAELDALKGIDGPVRVTVIVQPQPAETRPDVQPETRDDWLREALASLQSVNREPKSATEDAIVSSLDSIIKALEVSR